MIRAQGGDPDAALPAARETHVVDGAVVRRAHPAGRDGRRHGGLAARRRPRQARATPVQAGAGVVWHARPGDPVTAGQPLLTLLTDEPERFDAGARPSLRRSAYDIATPAGSAYAPTPCSSTGSKRRTRVL